MCFYGTCIGGVFLKNGCNIGAGHPRSQTGAGKVHVVMQGLIKGVHFDGGGHDKEYKTSATTVGNAAGG